MADEEEYLLQPEQAIQKKTTRERGAIERDLDVPVRAWQESGELRHLYGRPLDLSGYSDDWLIARTLKKEGFTHPLLERSREVDQLEETVMSTVRDLRQRHERLTLSKEPYTAEQATRFNEIRAHSLARFRTDLAKLNRAIRDYNLTTPTAMQRRMHPVERTMTKLEQEIPVLEPPVAVPTSRRRNRRLPWRRE